MAATQNILILSSNTGGGHRSAATALENSLLSIRPGEVMVKISQVLEEAHVMSRRLADVYNYLLRHHQDWMKYYYAFVNQCRPNESRLMLAGALRYGVRLLDRYAPHAAVSVHPMTQHFFAYLLRKAGLLGRIPLVSVVTDPCGGFWKGWVCQEVSRYFVATDAAASQLEAYGAPSHKICVAGLPVHSRFQPVPDSVRRRLRTQLGLHPDRFTVFLNAGWVGGGNIPRIYEALAQSPLPIQAVFLAGRNQRLIRRVERLASRAAFPTRVLGYTEAIADLMNAADVMISKPGGLTTFEALSCRLPILADAVTPPMPQEQAAADYIQRVGAGALLTSPWQAAPLIQSLLDSPNHCDMMRQAAGQCAKLGAADRIASEILAAL